MSALDKPVSLLKDSGFEIGSEDKELDLDPEEVAQVGEKGDDDANVGWHEFSVAKESGLRVTPEQSRRIARKIDLFILPMLCFCQGLSYRKLLNYANLYGMKTALHLSGDQFNWFASSEYYALGYLVGNYPDGWLLQHYPAGKVLSIMAFLWGIIIITTPACTNFAGTMINRLFLGLVEAVVTPGMTILTSIWYAQNEVPFRTLIWCSFNGWAGIVGGFLAYGIGHIGSPQIDLWKYIFLILGAVSLVFSVVLWSFFPDSPVEARFLTQEEKVLAVKRVAEAKLGVKNKMFKWYQVRHALEDPKTWLLLVATISGQIPNGIVTNFSSIIIKASVHGMGFTTLQTTLLDAASSSGQIVSVLVSGYICMRFRNLRVITMTLGNLTCIVAAACLTYLPEEQRSNRLVAYCFTSFQSVGFSLSLVMISNNIGGFTKKTFTTAVTFTGYCIGNIIGPHFLIDSEAPRYRTGTTAMLISYVIKTVCHLALGAYMLRSNIKRDREYGKVTAQDQLEGEEAGMRDLTEFENRYHRYVL
ncbi:MFS general substrate transporter [Lentinus tigrinus ALCF2SS1-7]|uniref:MFS general substrate transporter n=1 Tax=Lentinus tigrinus ALCF2SS1-7 TaxID=1328758 RepID=UPI0011660C9D|nr:MFS general substrate transporter [Lentinus tigrinus ALCF2SS1-7]